ncbi:ParB/RepB/Spo0J family partition protein [Paraburkholderia sp. A3RO-2L]|uniref:ParB/RepB/Spo0J family partition protein n=1 Tax=Paraburkholderia sp. A3RO-2L TaxID=3028376 RepID=UPI003DAA1A46
MTLKEQDDVMTKKSMLERMAGRVAAMKVEEGPDNGYKEIPLSKIRFNPNQPRKDFHAIDGQVAPKVQEELQQLADDIAERGLMHPITVREVGEGEYEVVIGERRTRALQLLNRETITAKVRNDLVGVNLDLYQLAENVQRSDLEENDLAQFIHKIVQTGEVSKQNLAKMFNKPASWVTRYLAFADPTMQAKWVQPGYVAKAWVLYSLTRLPDELQDEALEIAKARGTPLDSPDMKPLEARWKRMKEAAAQEAAERAVAPEVVTGTSGRAKKTDKHSGGKGSQATDNGPSPALTALFGDAASAGGDDGYRPDASELESLRQSPAGANGFEAPLSYMNDDPDRDLSGHERIGSMHRMPAGATSTVTSRVSLDQLLAVQHALQSEEVGAQMRSLAVEFRADESLLRAVLAALGKNDAAALPATALSITLAQVAQNLVTAAK